jgi:hypothetical protein
MQHQNRRVTVANAVKVFEKHGTTITIEEAQLMLNFLYKFAKPALDSILIKNK